MHKTIKCGAQAIEYTLKISTRARVVRVTVRMGGEVVLTVPEGLWKRLGEPFVHQMLQSREGWILAKIEHFKVLQKRVDSGLKPRSGSPDHPVKQDGLGVVRKLSKKEERAQYLKYKETARTIAEERVKYFNAWYGFKVGRISIKNTKTRWGSCSRKGNLNFNYKIALLPPHHADYIVVHELCHLGQFNHSKKFWTLVEKTIPDYDIIHRELKKSKLTFT